MQVIEGRADLTTLVSLIDLAGLRETLADPGASLTLFAPDNDAFAALLAGPDAPDVTDAAVVRDLLLAHVDTDAALLAAEILALTEVPVANGGPQPVDPGPPATIGGAGIVEADIASANGVIHVIDLPMPIQP